MICAILGRGRHAALTEEWKQAADAGADLVELRIDCLRREPDMKRILAEKPTKYVFTVRRGSDGGLWRGTEEKRKGLMRQAIVAGCDYVDIEMDVAREVRRYGKTKRVISYHNLKTTPPDLLEIAQQAEEMDADVVKIATRAHSVGDAIRVLQVASKMETPTIAIAMGEVGSFTRVLGAKFGAPYTYANFNVDRNFAPGMFGYNTLKRDYRYDEINEMTEVYAVIGDPIGHSLSPVIHNAAFRELGQNKVLVPIQIPAERLKDTLDQLGWLQVRGYSITIPHKQAVLSLLTAADGGVDRTGACNTMVLKEDGTRTGYNTDYRAAMESLEAAMRRDDDPAGVSPLANKQVVLLGAGGVARPIAFGLVRRGAGVTICNRTEENATALASEVGCKVANWGNRASVLADVVINCTPVGMHPHVDDSPMPPAGFRSGTVAMDTVYHPENTMFLKLARERECKAISGVDMFVRQAAIQSHLYTGLDAPVEVMREAVKRKLGAGRQ